jgi:uncharacterized protein YjcR
MNLHQRNELKKEAKALLLKGLTQKAIAEKLKVQPKTVGDWLKPLKARFDKMQGIEKKLLQKIDEALNNQKTTPKDIRDLFASLHILKAHQLKVG